MTKETYFENTLIGEEAPPKEILVQNTGYGTLILSDEFEYGTTSIDIEEIDELDLSIPTNKGIVVRGHFTPAVRGLLTRSIAFSTNDTESTNLILTFIGRGIAPEIRVFDPMDEQMVNGVSEFDFGGVINGTLGALLTFVIVNEGDFDLTGLEVSVGEEFAITQPASSIGPGASTVLQMAFMPSSVGAVSSTVSIASNDPVNNPFTFGVQGTGLSGSGFYPVLVVKFPDPDIVSNGDGPIDLGVVAVGDSLSETLSIYNGGDGVLYVQKVEITGPNADQFSVDGFSEFVQPLESIIRSVTFAPDSLGVKTATLTITSNDQSFPIFSITLTAEAIV